MSPCVPWVPSQGCSPRCGSHAASGEGLFPAHLNYNHKLIGICVVLSSQFFTVYSLGIFIKAQIIALWLLFRVSCLPVSDSALPQIPLFCLQLPHQALCSCECTQLGQQKEKKITKIIYLFKNTDPQVGQFLVQTAWVLLKPTGRRRRHWLSALSLLLPGLSLQTQEKERTQEPQPPPWSSCFFLSELLLLSAAHCEQEGFGCQALLPLPEALALVFVPVVFQLVPVHQAYLEGPWLWRTAGWGICSFASACWKKNWMALSGFNLLDVCFWVS